MKTIKCIGQFTIDDVVLPDGTAHMNMMGGNALYSAAGANLWCSPGTVGAVARIGADFPDIFLEQLRRSGFDVGYLRRMDRSHLRSWLLYETNRERRCLCRNEEVLAYPPTSERSFQQYLAAYRKLHLENSPLLSDLPGGLRFADAYHLAPQTYERHMENLTAIRACNPNALVSLDPSPFYMYSGNAGQCEKLFGMVDIIMPSREEVFSYFGEVDPERAAVLLTNPGPKIAAIKLGRQGVYLYDREAGQGWTCPAYDMEAVDVTGAGDSFCGGFLAGYLNSGEIGYAACCGTVSASYCIADYGPLSLLNAGKEEARKRAGTIRAVRGFNKNSGEACGK